jgi:hypothetical protein
MPTAHPLFLEVASLIRDLANDPRTSWGFGSYINPETGLTHFEEELANLHEECGVDLNDAVHVCKNGKITRAEIDVRPEHFRMEGFTIDGLHIGLGVSFNREERWLELITIFLVRE